MIKTTLITLISILFFSCSQGNKNTKKDENENTKVDITNSIIKKDNLSMTNDRDFVLYEEVIDEIIEVENISELQNRYNYLSILLLDSTHIELIAKKGCSYIDKFKDYAYGLPLSKQTIGFVTEKRDIKEIFKDKNTLKRILACVHTFDSPDIKWSKFNYPIYIKENSAVFEICGPTWSDTYYARLEDGIVQINWIYGIVE